VTGLETLSMSRGGESSERCSLPVKEMRMKKFGLRQNESTKKKISGTDQRILSTEKTLFLRIEAAKQRGGEKRERRETGVVRALEKGINPLHKILSSEGGVDG